MNRDDPPTGAAIALAAGELMATARRLAAPLPRLNESAPGQITAAIAAVRADVAELWPAIPPEAARDVMVTCARWAHDYGITELPEGLHDQTADWILVMTGRAGPETGAIGSVVAFASSLAFDRDEDDAALTSVSVLLTLAHLAIPGRTDENDPADPKMTP